MKKLTYILLFVLIVASASAQEVANNFISKFGGDKELEVVNIGKQMLGMISSMRSDDAELTQAIKDLESIKIITSSSKESSPKYFKHAYELLTKKSEGYQELMSMKEENGSTYIMTREADGIVKDLVLLTGGSNDFNMICLSGKIDMELLGKLSKTMNLNQLGKLSNTKNKTDNK